MKLQEANVYREIQKNTQTAMKAMDTIAGKVYDDDLALQIAQAHGVGVDYGYASHTGRGQIEGYG